MAWPPKIAHAKPHERPQDPWVRHYVRWLESKGIKLGQGVRITDAFAAGYEAGLKEREDGKGIRET